MCHLDLNQLRSIELGSNAVTGDSSDARKMIQVEPYNFTNTLKLKSRM